VSELLDFGGGDGDSWDPDSDSGKAAQAHAAAQEAGEAGGCSPPARRRAGRSGKSVLAEEQDGFGHMRAVRRLRTAHRAKLSLHAACQRN
jgi:hypothetical protein